jgi:hypothetical protein
VECVVDTGRSKYVASRIHVRLPTEQQYIPNMKTAGCPAKVAVLAMEPAMALVVCPPSVRDPTAENTAARHTAHHKARVREPTDVAKALARSFAPMA